MLKTGNGPAVGFGTTERCQADVLNTTSLNIM